MKDHDCGSFYYQGGDGTGICRRLPGVYLPESNCWMFVRGESCGWCEDGRAA
ncbi:MAG: hypothetical protein P4L55_14235 [Syntrophobacteraceae bacterium]|nr:hypothetical protein [Syntrophobacteraceae bacterium]